MLKGKTSLITGASRGIGKGIAEVFAKNGSNIAFTFASSVEKAKAFEEELSAKYGVKVKGYQSDAADYNAAMALADQVVADFEFQLAELYATKSTSVNKSVIDKANVQILLLQEEASTISTLIYHLHLLSHLKILDLQQVWYFQ